MATTRRLSVLVGADFRSGSCRAVIEAARLATRTGRPAALHAVYVAPTPQKSRTYERVAARVTDEILRFARMYGCRGVERSTDLVLSAHLRFGDPAEAIRSLASEVAADVIVVGPRPNEPAAGRLAATLREDRHRPVVVAGVDPTELPAADVIRHPACEPCARARRESEGSIWFCDRHRPSPVSPRAFDRVIVRHWTTWLPEGGSIPAF